LREFTTIVININDKLSAITRRAAHGTAGKLLPIENNKTILPEPITTKIRNPNKMGPAG
jgi:hypothetical protein